MLNHPSSPKADLAASIRQEFQRVLAAVPFLKIRNGRAEQGPVDWVLPVSAGDAVYELGLVLLSHAQPRQVRSAVYQLQAWLGGRPDRAGLLGAPYISPESAAILQQAGLGYLDLSGNCRLSFANVYIQREQFPNRFAQRRATRTVFSPRAERVLRVLLRDTKRTWKLQELASASQVSLGQCHNVVNFMRNQEWLRRDKQGLSLATPESLVGEWASNYRRERSPARDFHSLLEVHETELAIARACEGERYAFTGFSAGARIAPMVRYQRVSAYVSGDVEEVARRAGLKPVTSGANVTLITPYDEGVFYDSGSVDGLLVVSPLQAYLDLHATSGRGDEAAQAIYEQVLRKSW